MIRLIVSFGIFQELRGWFSKYIGNMENHWQTCSWSRKCTLSRHCLSKFGFGLVLCLTSGPKQHVKNTVHPLVYWCHQLVPSIVSTSEFWVRRKFTNCFSLMHTLETNMDAKNWWFPIKKHLLASRGGHPFSGVALSVRGSYDLFGPQ